MGAITLDISPSQYQHLQAAATQRALTLDKAVLCAIQEWLDKEARIEQQRKLWEALVDIGQPDLAANEVANAHDQYLMENIAKNKITE